jgi:LysR family hydrogen peroxide-inducible transcriptional activator
LASITQLEYIVAVDQEKHFGKAARKCHVAQPSLSMQVQKLEDELGVVIFDRSKKPILATETGAQVLQQARVVLREHRKLLQMAHMGSLEPQGDFHLGVIPTLSPYLIPLFIGHFSAQFPKVKLKISELQTTDIIEQLGSDDLDAGLLVTPLGNDQLIERHLFFEPFYAYVSQSHPLAKRKILAEQDISDDNLWLLEEGHCFRDQVLKVCSLDRRKTALANVEFASGNLETLKNLVKKNSGYTLLPELALSEMSKAEVAHSIKKFRKPVPTREVSLVHSRSFLKEQIISALETSIIDQLPQNIRSLKKRDIDVIDIF